MFVSVFPGLGLRSLEGTPESTRLLTVSVGLERFHEKSLAEVQREKLGRKIRYYKDRIASLEHQKAENAAASGELLFNDGLGRLDVDSSGAGLDSGSDSS